MGRLIERTILITGSSTGIGRAIAAACISEGATVMIHGRDEGRARSVAMEFGDMASYFVCDLEDPDNCDLLVRETVKQFGTLDGLVNNAALMTRSNLESTSAEIFNRIIAVNLRAPLLVTRAAMPHLLEAGDGVVVNIGSVNAYCGEPNLLTYSIAKGGLLTMTRNLANTYAAQRVRVNQVNVGWTLTENENEIFLREGYPETWFERVNTTFAPTGALLAPEDVANHVLFWLSRESAPITGAVYEAEQYPIIGRPSSGERLVSECR